MITTYFEKVVEYWEKQGIPAKVWYALDGFTTWRIDVPEDHPDIENPDHIGLLMTEKMYVQPAVFQHRLRVPLVTLHHNGIPAEVQDMNGKSGVALARNGIPFKHMERNIRQGGIKSVPLRQPFELGTTLAAAKKREIDTVLFFVAHNICETIPVSTALEFHRRQQH